MPRLTVRALAELMNVPGYEYERILMDQKHPRQEPGRFRIPYYQTALGAIRSYYRSGNEPEEITAGRGRANILRPDSKRQHNLRVLSAFAAGAQARRRVSLLPSPRIQADAHDEVEVRVWFDITGSERDRPLRIFYNFREATIDPEIAETTLQLASWAMAECGLIVPISALQYVDLASTRTYSVARQNRTTIRNMRTCARVIARLWEAL